MQEVGSVDRRFMSQALALALARAVRPHPNPYVGALVVKAGKVVGRGAHERFGGPHAEIHALVQAGARARGATLYLTLEPCSHHGKTPPCVDAVLKSGVRRVVVATKDPNPIVSGRGLRRLRAAGLKVTFGVLEREASDLNRDFAHWIRKKTPYVTLKLAQTLDGKIATPSGESRWITGEGSRRLAHRLRAEADAVLVGVGTVLADDPLLSVRLPGWKRPQPIKVILDTELRTPPRARVFSKKSTGPVFLATTRRAARVRGRRYAGKATILELPEKNGRVDLGAVLKELGARGIVRVLVEGGSETAAEALRRKAVHEVCVFVAPLLMGGRDSLGAIGGGGPKRLADSLRLLEMRVERSGEDLFVRGRL